MWKRIKRLSYKALQAGQPGNADGNRLSNGSTQGRGEVSLHERTLP
jgi:hypothetical protein